jgi:hypothetical protein
VKEPLARDTDEWAERLLVERWRAMTSVDKAAYLTGLCRSLHRLSVAGVRARHPTASEAELQDRATALRIGAERFAALTGKDFRRT